MTVVVIPGPPAPPDTGSPPGRLAATMLQVAVAGAADPPRFRRGKTYVADRAVTRLEITPGSVRAQVSGSRREPYQVVVACPTAIRPAGLVGDRLERQHITSLVPDANQLLCSCSCPDWDDPCKHAVATLLALANELITRPELLLAWRCEPDESRRATVGSRGRAGTDGDRHLRLVRTVPAPDPFDTDEWRAFLGEPVSVVLNDRPLPSELPPLRQEPSDIIIALRSALETLRL